MKNIITLFLITFLFAVIAISAQVKVTVEEKTDVYSTTYSFTVDSVTLEKFIDRYIERNSSKSTYTVGEIDDAITNVKNRTFDLKSDLSKVKSGELYYIPKSKAVKVK